jgi:hypothetical protein
MNVLAPLVGEKVGDFVHERGGSLVSGGIAGHLDGFGHDVADGFDLLHEEVLGLRRK